VRGNLEKADEPAQRKIKATLKACFLFQLLANVSLLKIIHTLAALSAMQSLCVIDDDAASGN
jgi:hypothetical protein